MIPDTEENSPEQISSPSPEEEDLIRCSTKKHKGDSPSFLPPRNIRSYKDSLVNPEGVWQDHTMPDFIHSEEADEVDSDAEDNMDDEIPVILLSKAEKERIHAPWRSALIIKVFGKSVGFKYMDFKVRSLWKPSGDMQCIDLGNDYFLIRFKLEEDYWKVVNGGPWFINQQFLTIRRWSPGFRPSEAKITNTAVWARLPELLIELYDRNILRRIGNQLGSLLKIDARTMDNERGRFARLCVQIDLDQPLTPKVRIGNMVQKIQYEGISTIYFECGRVGHRVDNCHFRIAPASPKSPEMPEPNPPPTPEEDPNNYGKWMMVSRRKNGSRKPLHKNATTSPDIQASTSHSKIRNVKFTNLNTRGTPLDPHKRSVYLSSVTIKKNQNNSLECDPLQSTEHPSTSQNMKIINHHPDIMDTANPAFINAPSQSPSATTSSKAKSLPSKDSTSHQHGASSPDSTSKDLLKVNTHFSADKVLNTALVTNPTNCNPLISMEIDTSTPIPLKGTCPQSHMLTPTCPETLPTHGSTSSIPSTTPPNLREQSSHFQQKSQHTPPDQKPSLSAVPTVTTHTPTLPPTSANNPISGKLGSTQGGNSTSHRRSPSKMVAGLSNTILDTGRRSNGTSSKNPNPSNSCEHSIRPSRSEFDIRTSNCVSHNHANIQRLSPLERTQGSDSRHSTD
jgi:hypothetical protein